MLQGSRDNLNKNSLLYNNDTEVLTQQITIKCKRKITKTILIKYFLKSTHWASSKKLCGFLKDTCA